MKIIVLRVTEDEYEELLRRARAEGYTLLSDYVRSVLLSETRQQLDINTISVKLERKIQDLINPFTAKIDELAKRVAELQLLLETGSTGKAQEPHKKIPQPQEHRTSEETRSPQFDSDKKGVVEILKERGFLIGNPNKLAKPEAYFDKLKKANAKIIKGEDYYIAIDKDFYDRFMEKLSKISTPDVEQAARELGVQEGRLFREIASRTHVVFDNSTRKWRIVLLNED